MRMQIRRLIRLTNAYSKKWENHTAALALCFAPVQLLPFPFINPLHASDGSKVTDPIWTINERLGATQN
jgi:hypothetical protein